MNLTQSELEALTGISQPMLSRHMSDNPPGVSREAMHKVCQGLEIPEGMAFPTHPTMDVNGAADAEASTPLFMAGTLGVNPTSAIQEWRDNRMTLDDAEVALVQLREAAPLLQRYNDKDGGGSALRRMAVGFVTLADNLVQQGVGDARQQDEAARLHGELTMLAGWMHYDGGNQELARKYWNSGLLRAQLSNNNEHEVYALESMSAQATYYLARPPEAIELARRAQALASRHGSARVRSLLELREACAWAVMGQEREFDRHYQLAATLLSDAANANDPDWVGFYGESELNGLYALALNHLGRRDEAESYFVSALSEVGNDYIRNRLYYTSMLAKTRTSTGDFAGALEVATEDFMRAVAKTGSVRTRQHAASVVMAAQADVSQSATKLVEIAAATGFGAVMK